MSTGSCNDPRRTSWSKDQNCNHDPKKLFKGAAAVVSSKAGPFALFFAPCVAKGMRPKWRA
jgi:hypothetical protein